jgi:hypothetical protein
MVRGHTFIETQKSFESRNLSVGDLLQEGPEKELDSCRDVGRPETELQRESCFRNAWLWVPEHTSRGTSLSFVGG